MSQNNAFTIKHSVFHAEMKTVKGAFCKFQLGNYFYEELKNELQLKNKNILQIFRCKEILTETGLKFTI